MSFLIQRLRRKDKTAYNCNKAAINKDFESHLTSIRKIKLILNFVLFWCYFHNNLKLFITTVKLLIVIAKLAIIGFNDTGNNPVASGIMHTL